VSESERRERSRPMSRSPIDSRVPILPRSTFYLTSYKGLLWASYDSTRASERSD
jgi:hypothetical protein